MEFPPSNFWVLQSIIPLSKAVLRSTLHCSVGLLMCLFYNRHLVACLLPSLTTEHNYFVLILRVTATMELSYDERLVVEEYTLTTSSSPKRLLWASL